MVVCTSVFTVNIGAIMTGKRVFYQALVQTTSRQTRYVYVFMRWVFPYLVYNALHANLHVSGRQKWETSNNVYEKT